MYHMQNDKQTFELNEHMFNFILERLRKKKTLHNHTNTKRQ